MKEVGQPALAIFKSKQAGAHLLFIKQLSEHREKPVALHLVAVVGKGLRQVAQRGLLLCQFEQLLGVTPDYVRGQR